MQRWIDRWDAYWFPMTTTLSLSMSRIIVVAAQLFWFFPSLHEHTNLLEKNSEFINPQLIVRGITAVIPREMLFTPATFTALYWITAVAGVAALVGFFTRTAVFILALGTWLFMAHLYSYADLHHPAAVFCIFLLLLAFSPSGRSLSLDAYLRRRREDSAQTAGTERVDTAMWPLKLAHVLLALTYFSAGMSKMLSGGLTWLNGYTMQGHLLADAILRDFPLGMWLVQSRPLCIALSVFTLIFELSFFLSLFIPWAAPFFFLAGLLFQLGLYATGGYDFFQHMVLLTLLLLFITPEWWRLRLERYVDLVRSRWQGQGQARQTL